MAANRVLQLNSKDNVLVALSDLRQGEQIEFGGRTIALRTDVPAKHKFATQEIAAGGAVTMYGVLIGKAVETIGVGEKLSTRNVRHEAAAFHEKTEEYRWEAPNVSRWREEFSRISARRWPGGNKELLAGSAAGVLRKPKHPDDEAGI